MRLRSIKGYSNYMFNEDTGDVVSMFNDGKVLSRIRHHSSRVDLVQMVRDDGKRRCLSLPRLRYAVESGIAYDDIPSGFYFVLDGKGGVKVIKSSDMVMFCNTKVRERRRQQRIQFIDDKIKQLEIMRRAYSGNGSYAEAVMYIEQRKAMMIERHMKKYGTSENTAENDYALALERMIERINNPCGQVTELTCSMLHLMGKVRKRERCNVTTYSEY